MNIALSLARKGLQKIIAEDQTRITVARKATVIDLITEEPIPDPYGATINISLLCRLPHERSAVPKTGSGPSGFSTNLERMALFDWHNVPNEGDIFTAIGKTWEIGAVDPIRFRGGIKGYQAPLREAT